MHIIMTYSFRLGCSQSHRRPFMTIGSRLLIRRSMMMARNKHISSDIWKTALNPSYPRWADLMDQNVVRSNSCVVSGVVVTNMQRKFPIKMKAIGSHARFILDHLKLSDFDVSILLCSESRMRSLHVSYFGNSVSTDIMSLRVLKFDGPEVLSKAAHKKLGMSSLKDRETLSVDNRRVRLGDIIICPAYVDRVMQRDIKEVQSGEFDYSDDAGVSRAMIEMTAKCTGGEQHSDALQDRISLLLIHGILHLFGHDHETDNDWARMTSREEELISALTNSDVWNHRLD